MSSNATVQQLNGSRLGARTLLYGPDGRALSHPTMTGYSHYGASRTKNSLAGWISSGGSPDDDITDNAQLLRERSRDAYMGICLACGALKTLVTNAIGYGLYATPNID